MNPHSSITHRKQVAWLSLCITIGAVVTLNPWYAFRFTPGAGWAAWGLAVMLVLLLTGTPQRARVAVVLAGLFLAVPCCLVGAPLDRGLLMCAMAVPAVAATAFVVRPPLPGLRARLAHLLRWGGAREVRRQPCRFDPTALGNLGGATVIFAAALAGAQAVPDGGGGLPLRWLAAGIALLAFAEMLTAGPALLSAAVGVVIPPLMRSPHRALSVGEFWSDRWNRFAAQKLFRPYCFQPLARRGWVALAVVVTFFISAVAHVLLVFMATGRWKISLMNGAFFMVQPVLLGLEYRMRVRRWRPVAARVWTLGALAVTSPLFLEPALQIIRASWGNASTVLLPTVLVLGVLLVVCGGLAVLSRVTCPAGNKGT
ncbi:MAG TPA: MBOAT family protein [Dongiaceae bacterium]|nr:MBOAT family protein [Dongiaceae bacterium]